MYRVRLQLVNFASLDLPRVMPMTCGGDKVAGQRLAQALLCKQGVGGSSPLVSTKVATAESVATGTSLATVGHGSKSPDHHSWRAPRIALRDRALACFEAGG